MKVSSMQYNRRSFLQLASVFTAGIGLSGIPLFQVSPKKNILTVTGAVKPRQMGTTLIHEHVLVDFIGADKTGFHRWDRDAVKKVVLPYLQQVKQAGCKTFVDCTPNYIGRDVRLLEELAEASGLQILTNTGYYGAVDNKFLPPHAFTESAEALAARWIAEFEQGIDGTGIRPGFIKIGVNPGELSDVHRKLITAAAKTHLRTGLTIASHTGMAIPAFQQMEVLKQEGVRPDAFIWVHAQNEKDLQKHVEAARLGAWVSLDGVGNDNVPDYVERLQNLQKADLLHRVLISHDAGWYSPGEENGGNYRGHTAIFTGLLPALQEAGFSKKEIRQLMVVNPGEAFQIRVRKL